MKMTNNIGDIINSNIRKLQITSVLMNNPMQILHSPGKDFCIWNPELDPEEVKKEREDINKKMIAELMSKLNREREKSEHFREGEKGWREDFTFLQNKFRIMQSYDIKDRIKSMEQTVRPMKRYENAALLVILVAAVGFLIFVLMMSGGGI